MINFYKGRSQPVKSVRIAVFEGYLGFSFLMSDRYRQTPPMIGCLPALGAVVGGFRSASVSAHITSLQRQNLSLTYSIDM
jgi:hypothetical protein